MTILYFWKSLETLKAFPLALFLEGFPQVAIHLPIGQMLQLLSFPHTSYMYRGPCQCEVFHLFENDWNMVRCVGTAYIWMVLITSHGVKGNCKSWRVLTMLIVLELLFRVDYFMYLKQRENLKTFRYRVHNRSSLQYECFYKLERSCKTWKLSRTTHFHRISLQCELFHVFWLNWNKWRLCLTAQKQRNSGQCEFFGDS